MGGDYQCHSCGREFAAALVRVPRAWDTGGAAMAEAAWAALPWPEAAVIEEDTADAQIEAQVRVSPVRPIVLGGCCVAHVGAVQALARRHGRLAEVWFDAHGDLNTPAHSPAGNAWGMALRMLIDAGDVDARDVTLLGVRSLDPSDAAFIATRGIRTELAPLPEHVYVAVDCDVVSPGELAVFRPEPGGMSLADLEATLASLPRPAGAGFTGLRADDANIAAVTRLALALGL
jgi:arginase family enzyme